MTLSKREKKLAVGVGVFGLLAVLVFLWQLGFIDELSLGDLQVKFDVLSAKVEKQKQDLTKANREAAKLDEWQRRSLPSKADVGCTLYLNWLRETVDKASFRGTIIGADEGQSHHGTFEEVKFTVKAQASLKQLTQFLYDFYQAGHLHKISNLQITPLEKSGDLDVNLTIQALSLAAADQTDKLTVEKGKRLRKSSFDDYGKMIVDRSIFTAYTPPKPKENNPPAVVREEKPLPPKFEHLEFTKLTGITESDGQALAWIETKTTGQSYKAREGDEVDIASAKVKILRIGTRDMDIQIGEVKRTIDLGQNLLGKP
jgi:hypothetical protein